MDKLKVVSDGEPWVLTSRREHLMWNKKIKEVVVGRRGDFKLSADIDCSSTEVVALYRHDIVSKVFRKYNISRDNRKERNWPMLLSESKAKEIILSYANKIGLPKDVELSNIELDKQYNGTWTAYWKRKCNGFAYEDDSFFIAIMAIDGEFYSYGKFFLGKPCPTKVKVTKEEAIAKGWDKISKYFDSSKWEKLKNEYEVKSTELKIVQPNVFLGFVIPIWKSENSRLAWVINYAPIIPPDDNKRIEIGYHDRFVIKIDAATKRFLGGETGAYR